MENGRSALGILAGFVFWLGIAYYFYQRDFMGALWFVAAYGLIYGIYRLITHLLASNPKPRHMQDEGVDPPPRSDLPDYDFENAKPKDFE
ncbi:MAG: hypothetical protein OXL41_10035 [Nitrospinae bacterium]|nr:hypothetical protein [Nitrospinota bacterium]